MAVIWQKRVASNHYEIRTAGATRRLYTNGVLHSQYNPKRILTGSIWDLLFIASYFHLRKRPLRVLVLGVGAGAVIRMLQHFHSVAEIHGVELDATHLYVAQRFFQIDGDELTLYQQDARDWLAQNSQRQFDIIIEDLFTEQSRQPIRAINANEAWYRNLIPLLKPSGVLIMNFASDQEFKQSAAIQVKQIKRKFKSIFRITMPSLDNCVGVYLNRTTSAKSLHAELIKQDEIRKAIQSKYLRYRIRQYHAE